VKKNQLLATFYSREFRNAEQAYLGSLSSLERVRGPRDSEEQAKTTDANLRINEEQLRALGMGDPQIKDLARTRQITRDIEITSPTDGIVLARNISPEQRFEGRTEFYRVADLSKVWILADLFGDEATALRPGTRVKITVRELERTLYATVSQNPPLFDPESRTLKLRLEADNPGLVLRPDMFVDVEFEGKAPAGLTVPAEAVLDSGTKKIVYIESSEGVFEPRPVLIGAAYGSRVSVTRGLSEGDRVVTSGNFLIDSESRMRNTTLRSVTEKSENTPDKITDPVCGMAFDRKQAEANGRMETYHGQTFMFCSDQCRKKFQQDPAKYVDEKVNSASRGASRHGDD
jgi:Cu(I)/Ag(I) efflux system membrane fusion protein